MDSYTFLSNRLSVPSRLLGEPGPSADDEARLFQLAVRVPDHGRLAPWRFITLRGAARVGFGDALVALRLSREPSLEPAALDKDRERYRNAPLVVVVVASTTPGHKIPVAEQVQSAGLAAYNLLLGAQALGYGAQWLTGWAAYDMDVARLLGLGPDERVIGFVHIGTAREAAAERARPDPATRISDWQPPGTDA
jgi:nitroreductase